MEEQRLQKLKEKQIYESRIKNIMSEIDNLSRKNDIKEFEIAIGRWKADKLARRAAERDIAEAEARLEEAKKRYRR